MPAPKAVLRDIAERGLDPTRVHGRIGSDGRLAGAAALPVHVKQEVAVPKAADRKPHVDPAPPPVPQQEEAAPKPVVEEVRVEAPVADVVDEKAADAAKKPRGKKPPVESQA